ncbi:hypothetical protein [Burkholderia cenocepacia]|uniref:hypothetical protein n=1 Tax=Burkholderia cenocepacia TaxID=95486 RepID=UPI0015C2FBBC|nr:hypothetical protein [Burkholderia cenocepacia]
MAISSVSVVPMPEVNSSPRKLTAPRGLFETVSKRTVAGVKLPWYEVETFHANVARWVYRESATDIDVAVDAANKTRLMNDSPEDGDEEEDS